MRKKEEGRKAAREGFEASQKSPWPRSTKGKKEMKETRKKWRKEDNKERTKESTTGRGEEARKEMQRRTSAEKTKLEHQ